MGNGESGQAGGVSPVAAQTPRPKRRRERGDDGIHWDKVNKCYQGTISLGYDDAGKRLRRTVRGKTKQEVKDKLDELHDDLKAGVWTPALRSSCSSSSLSLTSCLVLPRTVRRRRLPASS